jgi:hypothetical protein
MNTDVAIKQRSDVGLGALDQEKVSPKVSEDDSDFETSTPSRVLSVEVFADFPAKTSGTIRRMDYAASVLDLGVAQVTSFTFL